MFTKSLVFLNNRYPFYLAADGATLIRGVIVYLLPNVYNKNKPFLKNVSETGEVAIDSFMFSDFRTQLKDLSYTVAKIHCFSLSVFPDFKIEVKLKGQTSSDPLKHFFELSSTIDKTGNETIALDNMKTTLKDNQII